jgi:hypothetical protein
MARIHASPATIAAVPSPVRYTTPDPSPVTTTAGMTAEQHERYEALLRQWRDEGHRLTWEALRRAYTMAMD